MVFAPVLSLRHPYARAAGHGGGAAGAQPAVPSQGDGDLALQRLRDEARLRPVGQVRVWRVRTSQARDASAGEDQSIGYTNRNRAVINR